MEYTPSINVEQRRTSVHFYSSKKRKTAIFICVREGLFKNTLKWMVDLQNFAQKFNILHPCLPPP
jgi:hypothetical protein